MEKYSDTLQPANDRLHRSQQSLKEKHIDDIYTAIKCINKKYPCERELPVTLVAANLANILTSTRESFQQVLGRNHNRKQPPVVYGTNSNATLKAGPRRHEIFIFRVDSETSDDQIKDFVKGDNRSVVNIECKSLTDSWTKCYRLVVQCPDIEPLLDPSFWGNGIGVRRYFIKRNRTL